MRDSIQVEIIPACSDNYQYVISENDCAVVIDPSDAATVLKYVDAAGLDLRAILCTHHHQDHVGGIEQIKDQTGADVCGFRDGRIPQCNRFVADRQKLAVHSISFEALHVPGHTSSHLAFYCADGASVFTGDALFAGGCGRLFEGTAEQMWHSLQKIAALPEQTRIYCGHEYTEENLCFALSIDPDNMLLQARLSNVAALRSRGHPTIPSTVQQEQQTNPFLRTGDAALRARLGMEQSTDIDVFAELRRRKDRF
ncbi:MAG: hydroxyacylglutathione hydrolase [Chitinivibrionales bacterium]|nr:hydroxyacylglutathione hydrolase [Chitinivibrionales bacterium]